MVRKLCWTALVWVGWTSSAHAQGYSVVGGGATSATPPTGTRPRQVTTIDTGTRPPDPTPPRHEDVRPHVESNREPWDYAGVAPGNSALPPGMGRRGQRHARNQVAWPGFQMTPSGSRVFVALTSPPVVTVDHRPGRVVYVLHGASVPVRNNRRALETEAFDTPVSRALLRTHGGNAELVIELRAAVEPQMTTQANGAGLSYVFVDFPAWTGPGGHHTPHRPASPGAPSAAPPSAPEASPAPRAPRDPNAPLDDETPPPIVMVH